MLYESIRRLEKRPPSFNSEQLSYEELVEWAEHAGILVLEDRSISTAASLKYKETNVILCNPWLPEGDRILTVGHELGHHILGHVDSERLLPFSKSSLFVHHGTEKDASIIGHLCLIPTARLLQLADTGRLDAEELYRGLHPWLELEEGFGWEICMARIRIFRALMRVKGSRQGGSVTV